MVLSRSACLWMGLLCACSPVLDWRQVKPGGLELEAMFPCRPATLSREVPLSGRRVVMVMHACAAGGSTFAVGALTLDDVRDVGPALVSLRDAAARNLGGGAASTQPVQVPGMTPQEQAVRVTLAGHRPDGSAVVEHIALFARGARVYQAMVVGDQPEADAVSTFFNGLKVGS